MAVRRLTTVVSIDGFSNPSSVLFFSGSVSSAYWPLISVSFTARNKFFSSTVRLACLRNKKHDTYDIVYTLMDTAFLY